MRAAGQLVLLRLYVGKSDEPWPVHSNWHAVWQLTLLCLPLRILAIPWPGCSDVCAIRRLALFLLLLCNRGGGSPTLHSYTSTYLMSVTGCLMLSSSNLAAGISEGNGLWFGSSMLYPVQ